MATETGEEENVEVIGGGGSGEEEEEGPALAGQYPLPGTVPKGIEDRLTTWLNRSESTDPYEERYWTRKLNNYAYDVAAKRPGAGLSDDEMKAFLKQYPKLPVDAVFEWNVSFRLLTGADELRKEQDNLWVALDGTLYKKWSGRIEDPWLVDIYYNWKSGKRRRDELILERGEWVALTARVELAFDDVAGTLWQLVTIPVLKPIVPGLKDAYKKRMNKALEAKPEEAIKMMARYREFRGEG